jgi:hypothetical protein
MRMRLPRAGVAMGAAMLGDMLAGCGLGAPRTPAGIHKIRHVIVIFQENRSFDSYFGTYPGADGIPMQDGLPTVCVPDPHTGQCVKPYVDHQDVNGGGPHWGDFSAPGAAGRRARPPPRRQGPRHGTAAGGAPLPQRRRPGKQPAGQAEHRTDHFVKAATRGGWSTPDWARGPQAGAPQQPWRVRAWTGCTTRESPASSRPAAFRTTGRWRRNSESSTRSRQQTPWSPGSRRSVAARIPVACSDSM